MERLADDGQVVVVDVDTELLASESPSVAGDDDRDLVGDLRDRIVERPDDRVLVLGRVCDESDRLTLRARQNDTSSADGFAASEKSNASPSTTRDVLVEPESLAGVARQAGGMLRPALCKGIKQRPQKEVELAAPYTHTSWLVKRGREQEFVQHWSEWADWSRRQGLAAHAILLRDVDNPERFVSFGPWETMQAVRSWRALTGYHERVARLREVVDEFEPRTLEVVARR